MQGIKPLSHSTEASLGYPENGGRKRILCEDRSETETGGVNQNSMGVLVGLEAGEAGAGTTVKHRLCCRALGVFW